MRALLIMLSICLGACGAPAVPDPPLGIGTTGKFLDESVRLASVNAAKLVQANGGTTRDEKDSAMVAALLKDPNVEAAGISTKVGNVWARFIDGTLYLDYSERDDDVDTLRSLPPSPRAFELPGNLTAITGNSLEAWWTDSSGKIGGWLASQGYSVTAQQKPLTVADLQAMSKVGVLFWQTHGGTAALRAFQRDAKGNILKDAMGHELHQDAFAYLTNSLAPVPPAPPPADLLTLRNANLITLATVSRVRNGGPTDPFDNRYGVTAGFITSQMTGALAPNALVAIDACNGAAPEMNAAWAKIGAAGFVSWDILSGDLSGLAFEKLFDRLLGMNSATPVPNPLERSFDLVAVRDWMVANQYDLDASARKLPTDPQAKLVWTLSANGGLLKPTITNILFDGASGAQPYPKLRVQGNFGSDPGPTRGVVTWGLTPLETVQWDSEGVLVKLPAATPYPTGKIQVAIDGVRSEAVPLTTWNLPLTFTRKSRGTLEVDLFVTCQLRSDVRGFRRAPEQALQYLPMNTENLLDSSGSVHSSGQYPVTGTPDESWAGDTALTVLPLDYSQPPQENFFSCAGEFDHGSGELTLQVAASGDFSHVYPGGSSPDAFSPQLAFPAGVTIALDPVTFTLKGNTLTGTSYIPGDTITVSWPDEPPISGTAPTASDPR